MLFSEPAFLFFFLPAVLLAYFGLGRRTRDLVLVASSLLFYAWGERRYVLCLMISIALNWLFAFGVAGGRSDRRSRWTLAFGVGANLLLLIGFKYANFIVDNLNVVRALLGAPPYQVGPVHLPIGISFFAFQGISYLIDVYRGDCSPQRSLMKMAMYKSFFPQLIAGPIVRYVDIRSQIDDREVGVDDFADGARRFVVGLGKKVVIANVAARPADEIFALPSEQLTTPVAWLGIVAYTLQIYFDFSAYSDMAIGLGRMFGFRFLENFNYPYIASSMTDFWRRWHISLSTWFRDYLYIPLGGNRVGPGRRYANLIIVFFLCGLWHGASWNFAIWGLFHGAFLVLERVRWLEPLRVRNPVVKHAYVILAVMVGWVFFRADDLPKAISFLETMAGFSRAEQPIPDLRMFADAEVRFAIAAGVVGATPILPALAARFESMRERGTAVLAEGAALVATTGLFVYSAMSIAAGSYSPFIYFRF